jgi:hypothetical protein
MFCEQRGFGGLTFSCCPFLGSRFLTFDAFFESLIFFALSSMLFQDL